MYDPISHEALEADVADATSIIAAAPRDRRWVRIRRPVVIVGGELTLDMLDLTFNPLAKFYDAPLQLKANGGVFVVDDFGRQRIAPRDLLNRWIVPLESRVDFLSLQTGQKFDLPFMVLVVFATNIKPAELVDEAFLRRIHYKVFAESPTAADFERIFRDYCAAKGLTFDKNLTDHLIVNYFRPRSMALRGCLPRDLIEQALAHAEYIGAPRELTVELLEAACAGYFVDDTENARA
jgi:SpoVK/Ycf46/Vps4 family AAA+-type ATPase